MFSQVGKEMEVKTLRVYHYAACLIYAAAHNKQLLVNNVFMPSIDFYEYHKNKKLMVLFALLPTHTYPHNAFKSNLPRSMWYMRILIFICIAFKKELRITSLNYLHNNLYFWNSEKNRALN